MKRTRAELGGRLLGRALVEMINLMYQNDTALHFFKGLVDILWREWERRVKERK